MRLSLVLENIVRMHSIEFLKQEDVTLPKICSQVGHKGSSNSESKILKKIIQQEFNREIVILETSGSLKIYKGDLSLITLLGSHEIPKHLQDIIPAGQKIINISNPKKSRLTLHFNDETFRMDFHYKAKLRDYNLLSCIHVMHNILSLEVFYRFYQHFLYLVFYKNGKSTQSSWTIFTDLFFAILERGKKNLSENLGKNLRFKMKQKTSDFEKMFSSRTSKQLFKGLKPVLDLPKETNEIHDSSELYSDLLFKNFSSRLVKEFQESAENLFEILHLMREDYKLNIFKHKLLNEGILTEFLFKF